MLITTDDRKGQLTPSDLLAVDRSFADKTMQCPHGRGAGGRQLQSISSLGSPIELEIAHRHQKTSLLAQLTRV